MELKFWFKKGSMPISLLFKSHLYGIEIRIESNMPMTNTSLNRTFMELKFG